MKPYNSIIHSILIIGLTLVCIYLLTELNATKELLSRVVSTMNPQKAKPNDLRETHISILLTFIGVGFALFAFLTFQGVKDFFDSKIEEVKKEQKEKDNEHEKQIHRVNDLENEVLFILSTIAKDASNKNFKGNQNWLGLYHAIKAIHLYSKRYAISEEDKADKNNTIEEMLRKLLSNFPNKIDVNSETKSQLLDISHQIVSSTNMESSVLLTKIIDRCEVIKGV